MGKGKRNRELRRAKTPKPGVRARVVLGDIRLDEAVDVIRPALLYADHVTVHAPAASMLLTLGGLAEITDPVDQLDFIIAMSQAYPDALGHVDVPLDQLEQFRAMLSVRRRTVRKLAKTPADRRALDELYEQVDNMRERFEDGFGKAMEKATADAGAEELISAAKSGLLVVEPLEGLDRFEAFGGALQAASGGLADGWNIGDDIALNLLNATIAAATQNDAIPVLDGGAAGLARSLASEGLLEHSNGQRRTQIHAVAGLMGNLPDLAGAPLSDVANLRDKLRDPLTRFRAAIIRMSSEFSSEVYDEDLKHEVQTAWLRDVAPALLEIQEVLRDQGLLRSFISTAMEKPSKLLAEAGAAGFIMGHAGLNDLSGQLLAAASAAVPLADAGVRALRQSIEGQKKAERNDFYFLYVADQSQR